MSLSSISNPTASVAINEDVVARSVGDEMVLLDLESGTYFTLNGVGAAIWRYLEEGKPVEAIAQRIADAYEVSSDQALADASALIDEMAANGLLVLA